MANISAVEKSNKDAITRSERLWRELADDIITGRLPPGTRLYEQELTERFDVSRTPVREALRHLAAIGLVETRPQRGMVVAPLDLKRVQDLFEAMAELEALCARFSADRMTREERREFEKLHRKSAQYVKSESRDEYTEANHRFHTLIYKGSHNSVFEEMALSIRRRLAPYRSGQFHLPGRLENSFKEHQEIVDAIVKGDSGLAEAATRRHVTNVSVASVNYVHVYRALKEINRK